MRGPTQNVEPFGSAVLTVIEYKHPDRRADKQSIYIYLPVFGWYINNQIFINPPMFRTLPSN